MDESLEDQKGNAASFHAFLDLIRLPNLFTAVADVLAGFYLAGGRADEWSELVRLAVSSACLYAGGVALNDVCDAAQDASERAHRPIPSGKISRAAALHGAMTLLLAGVIIAATVSEQAALVSAAITCSIAFYNFLKRTWLAPPLMGLCRAWNLLLGMYGMETLIPPPAFRAMLAMFVYVTSLTFFAGREARISPRWRLIFGSTGMAVAILSLWGFRWYGYNARFAEYRYLAAAMLAVVLYLARCAVIDPSPPMVQRAVKMCVLGIVLLDACVAWVSAGPLAAASVSFLLIPSLWAGRFLRVT